MKFQALFGRVAQVLCLCGLAATATAADGQSGGASDTAYAVAQIRFQIRLCQWHLLLKSCSLIK